MQYNIKVNDRVYAVQTNAGSNASELEFVIDGEIRNAIVKKINANQLHLSIGERSENLFVFRNAEGTWIWVNGKARLAQDADAMPRRRAAKPEDTPGEITPPTPASVVRVLVEPGDMVTKGQGCVVVSAMKMEITLNAPYNGTVKAVHAAAGQQVSPGEILVEIELVTEANQDE